MQIEVGTIIIDKSGGGDDIGVVTSFAIHPNYDDNAVFEIYWVCPRERQPNYTTTLLYPVAEIKEFIDCGMFEVIEKRTKNVLDKTAQSDTL